MAAERDFEPAAERGAMNGGDDGLVGRLHGVDHGHQAGFGERFAKLANVRAGDKGRTITDQHHGLDAGVGEAGLYGGLEAGPHRLRQRIDGRVGDSDDADVTFAGKADDLGHGGLLGKGWVRGRPDRFQTRWWASACR